MTGAETIREYARAKGLAEDAQAAEIGPFGDTPEMADELLRLIRAGKKRATCWACIGEEPPAPGTLSVVTDWNGQSGCVLQTVRAQIVRFSEVTWALARLEGADECLESWREKHMRFFSAEGRREGYTFSKDMEIIFEEFSVVWPEEDADEAED